MLGIIAGLLAGVAGLLAVPLAAAVMAVLGPVLGLYQSVEGMVATVKTAKGSSGAEARSGRGATVEKLPEGRRDAEEPRLAA